MISKRMIIDKAKVIALVVKYGIKYTFPSFLKIYELASWSKYSKINWDNFSAICHKNQRPKSLKMLEWSKLTVH